jgi:hypothetical protein
MYIVGDLLQTIAIQNCTVEHIFMLQIDIIITCLLVLRCS